MHLCEITKQANVRQENKRKGIVIVVPLFISVGFRMV